MGLWYTEMSQVWSIEAIWLPVSFPFFLCIAPSVRAFRRLQVLKRWRLIHPDDRIMVTKAYGTEHSIHSNDRRLC